MAQMMQMTLLTWFVLQETDSPFLVALIGAVVFLPTLLLGAVGGLLADKVDRRRLLVTTQGVNLAASLAFTLLLSTGLVEYWHAYLMMFVVGTGWALDFPSRRSIIHDLMGDSFVTNGMALEAVGLRFSWMSGPALAGGLIILVDFSGGYVVVTLLYLVALALILSLRLTRTTVPQHLAVGGLSEATPSGDATSPSRRISLSGTRETFRNLGEGFSYVRRQETIWATVLITVLMNLFCYPYMQMVPVIARDVLGVGPGLMGVLMSSAGIGALVGAVIIASSLGLKHQGRVYIAGSILAMIALLLFSFSSRYALSLALMLMLGLGTAAFGTMQATIIMLVAREEMRGRALGVISLAIGTLPIGMVLTGAVASATSPTLAIGLNAGVGLVLVALVALVLPSLRQRIVRPLPAVAEPIGD